MNRGLDYQLRADSHWQVYIYIYIQYTYIYIYICIHHRGIIDQSDLDIGHLTPPETPRISRSAETLPAAVVDRGGAEPHAPRGGRPATGAAHRGGAAGPLGHGYGDPVQRAGAMEI